MSSGEDGEASSRHPLSPTFTVPETSAAMWTLESLAESTTTSGGGLSWEHPAASAITEARLTIRSGGGAALPAPTGICGSHCGLPLPIRGRTQRSFPRVGGPRTGRTSDPESP